MADIQPLPVSQRKNIDTSVPVPHRKGFLGHDLGPDARFIWRDDDMFPYLGKALDALEVVQNNAVPWHYFRWRKARKDNIAYHELHRKDVFEKTGRTIA